MTSFKLWFLLGVYLTLLHSAFSDPIPQNETISTSPDVGNCGKGGKSAFRRCITSHMLPANETQNMYKESRCPTCAHICSNSQSILDCTNNAINDIASCNKYIKAVGAQFYRDVFQATVTFFCEGGGDKLTTIDDGENMRCIVTQEGTCNVNIMHDNRSEIDESSSSESDEVTPEMLCRQFTTGLSCLAKKAESCNQETAALLISYADYLKTTNPCSVTAAGS